MKKAIIIAATALLACFASCNKQTPEPEKIDIKGEWEFSSYSTKAVNIGSEPVSVYLVFGESEFTVYQQLSAGRYRRYEGKYEVNGSTLKGTYTNGDSLNADYTIQREGNKLTLSTDKESYGYTSCSVPELVKTESIAGQ